MKRAFTKSNYTERIFLLCKTKFGANFQPL